MSEIADLSFDPGSERYISLATFRRDGSEVRTPVWLVGSGGLYYLFSAGEAGKIKRVRANSRARMAACDIRGNVSGPWLEAQARIVTEPDIQQNAYLSLRQKYGWQIRLLDFFSSLAKRKQKRAVIELKVTEVV